MIGAVIKRSFPIIGILFIAFTFQNCEVAQVLDLPQANSGGLGEGMGFRGKILVRRSELCESTLQSVGVLTEDGFRLELDLCEESSMDLGLEWVYESPLQGQVFSVGSGIFRARDLYDSLESVPIDLFYCHKIDGGFVPFLEAVEN